MFVIIWGTKVFRKKFGERNEQCRVCKNPKTLYMRTITWFTLFYIPLFPISKKYFKFCPICLCGVKIKKKQFFDELQSPDIQMSQPFENLNESEIEKAGNLTREIIIIRDKRFGGTLSVNYFIDNKIAATARRGEEVRFTVDNKERVLFAKMTDLRGDEICSNFVFLPPDDINRVFRLKSLKLIEEPVTINEEF